MSRSVASQLPNPPGASPGRKHYVSPLGSDSNPGTPKRPWRTIQKALNTLRPGQTALVLGGTYTENLMFRRRGTASAPITVAADPGDRVVLRPAKASPDGVDWYPVQITGSYFRLHGFVIENGLGTSDANVYLWGGASHIELSGNDIQHGQDQGIFADNTTSYLYLLANRIHDNGWNHVSDQHQSNGIYLEGRDDLVANNLIYNQSHGFGLQIYPANHDTIVVDNTIAASAHSSIVVGGSGGVSHITIRNNILYASEGTYGGDYGVEMDSTCPTGPVTIDHNVIYAYAVAAVEGGCSTINLSGGNVLANPLFVDYPSRDLRLRAASPAIDRANSDWSESVDIDGVHRPQGAGPDIGAFERRAKSRSRPTRTAGIHGPRGTPPA